MAGIFVNSREWFINMFSDIRASWALFTGVGFIMLANGLQGTLLGLRATLEGFPTTVTGIMMSAYFVGILGGSMTTPHLVRRVGHIRVFGALASLASISILVHGLFVNPTTWILMRLITGFSYAGLFVVSESWLNDRASNQTRGKLLSVYMLVVFGGMGGGQFLLNVADPQTIELFVLTSVIVSLGLIPMLLTARPAPSFGLSEKMSLRKLFKLAPLAMIANGLTGVAHGTIWGLGAVYGQQSGFTLNQISWFMASFTIGAILFQWPMGIISDRIDRRKVLLFMALGASIVCIIALQVSPGSFYYYGIIILLGGFAMPLYSLCIAYANDRLESDQMVAASGGMLLAGGVGLSIGPVVTSYAMSVFGPDAYFVSLSISFLLVVLFSLYRMGQRAPVSVEDQVPYISAGHIGTPVAEDLAVEDVMQDFRVAADDDDDDEYKAE